MDKPTYAELMQLYYNARRVNDSLPAKGILALWRQCRAWLGEDADLLRDTSEMIETYEEWEKDGTL